MYIGMYFPMIWILSGIVIPIIFIWMDIMKIVFLAPANSAHTKKWCKWFSGHGHQVKVISLAAPDGAIDAEVHYLDSGTSPRDSDWQKLGYLTQCRKVRKLVNALHPDVLNVHYATSYGALAVFAGLKDYILSVWGSDVYTFPRKSFLHRYLLKLVLRRAGLLFSTSQAMADEAAKYTDQHFEITPFGVDMELFSPALRNRSDDDFVIGTVKTLSPKYGIATILRAAAKVREERPDIPLKLRIAGKGSHEPEYHKLAADLGLDDCLQWLGFISQLEAAKVWANLDCAIIPSESESFGVSAVEAQSCGCPVIISDIPGLMEATNPGKTSMVIPRGNVDELVEAIVKLYQKPELRKKLGEAGRAYVRENYELNDCFAKVEKMFYSWIKNNSR